MNNGSAWRQCYLGRKIMSECYSRCDARSFLPGNSHFGGSVCPSNFAQQCRDAVVEAVASVEEEMVVVVVEEETASEEEEMVVVVVVDVVAAEEVDEACPRVHPMLS